MKKSFKAASFGSAALFSLFLVGQTPAQFQPQGYRQPQFGGNFQGSVLNPFLFLNTPGLTPSQAYFGIVQPQLGYNDQANRQQSQIYGNQGSIAGLQQNQSALAQGIFQTGERPRFLSYQQYFLNLNATANLSGTTGIINPSGGGGGIGSGASFGGLGRTTGGLGGLGLGGLGSGSLGIGAQGLGGQGLGSGTGGIAR